ncbi:inward rectifier potassium channel 2-like [Styela clava]
MTFEAADEVKKDVTSPHRTSTPSDSDDVESEETELSDAISSTISESDSERESEQFDKNNNRSPSPNTGLRNSWNFTERFCAYTRSDNVWEHDMEAQRLHQDFKRGASNTKWDGASDSDDELYDVFDSDEENLTFLKNSDLNTRYANANQNNNSNRKRFRNMSSGHSGLYDPVTNTNNHQFRNKFRSVQLSSIRAGKGKYMGKDFKPYQGRMVLKDGSSNVRYKRFGRLDWMSRYSKDIYTTLIDLSLPWVILLTALVYVGHWIIFGIIYWLFAFAYDDYTKIFGMDANTSDIISPNSSTQETIVGFNDKPCVSGVYDFATAFLFSMESETTIGYGFRTIGTSCRGAVACLVIQCVLSAIFDTWVIGMCFSRMARPDARCKTILYSKNAVICTRDGKKCLLVRVANLRKSLLLSVSCRARVIIMRAPQCKEEEEDHEFMLEQKELKFCNANLAMLTTPLEYCHVIDKDSPLYSIPPRYLASEKQNWFEVVVILTGMVEATGMTANAQTSYLSTEINYKHRFAPIVSLSPKRDRYVVDFSKFHDTIPEPPEVANSARLKRKQARLINGNFDVLQEEKEEDIFDNESYDGSVSKCNYCGSRTYGDNNMNATCVCENLNKNV